MAGAVSSVEAKVTEQLRVPPHSVEAEQAVLGGLMLDNTAWDKVADRITEEDFYRHDHRLVFRALKTLAENGKPLDAVTVGEWLESNALLEETGGLVYLGKLAKDTPSAANARAYADIVRERSILRQLIRIGGEISDAALNTEGKSSIDLVEKAEQLVFRIAEHGSRAGQGFQGMKTLLTKAVDRLDTLFHSQSNITGIASGYADFDNLTAGLQRSDLIIIAGRPSMGKTSFAMNIAEHVALNKLSTAVFSMEMSAEQLVMRLIASHSRIDQSKIRTGRLDDSDWPRITSAVTLMSEAPIFIDDSPALTPTEIRARCRRLKREHGLDLVIVDYLQLMQVPSTVENRATEISEISRGLKALAKELDVPVVALSQLNRNLEQRTDKRPVMSDLRESGSIEQDADAIVFIYRDEVYNKDDPNNKGKAEIIVAKQRNGPTDTVLMTFLGNATRFENYARDDYGGEFG